MDVNLKRTAVMISKVGEGEEAPELQPIMDKERQ